VNNYDWMKDYTFLDFAREVGKLITVNYMMAKDSVKKRFNGEASQGMSFTEFTYQLLQGYDYVYLNKHKNCKLQMGGSDQWGNITTGTELIKKMGGGEAYALTCPLITKADGGKFGKTESGNIWLDRKYTSPYRFYQFWLNVSDDDAKRYIRIFTCLDRETIDALIAEHDAAPHTRALQKRLAEEVTVMVHSREDYEAAVEASNILFGNATQEALNKLDEETFLQVFDGVEKYEISRAELEAGIPPLDLLAEKTKIFPSKGEARKMIMANGFSINKEKFTDPQKAITAEMLLKGKYLLCQKGKKNYYIVEAK
jgi:tyrosyl-tRNA synthetase